MRLTDNEKRDAIKLLQEGKPLPEKYRFLLFSDDREVELVWNGKTQEVCNLVLPFQTIEHIDEPRAEHISKTGNKYIGDDLFEFDPSGRQIKGWTNKLIWGDNKLVLSSIKNGPMRQEIERQGGLKLIYIDPPFDVGADFSVNIEIGDEQVVKSPSVIEEVAYRDTWGKGADSFISMIYERLLLMRDLLADDGSIYIHCDWRVSPFIKLLLEEIFGEGNFRNEIIWKRSANTSSIGNIFKRAHDTIFFYSKSDNHIFNFQRKPLSDTSLEIYSLEDSKGKYRLVPLLVSGKRNGNTGQVWKGVDPNKRGRNGMHWITTHEKLELYEKRGLVVWPEKADGAPNLKYYLGDNPGVVVSDFWDDINPVGSGRGESVAYPTQKPEQLMERVILTSSNEGDLIADFFCGSGTTLAAAERLGRKWIGSDLGRFAIHTSRKRLIQVQREMKASGKDFRAFEILNLGKYEREQYLAVDVDIREKEKQKILDAKEKQFIGLILSAYKAEPVNSYNAFVGKKRDRLVAVGPINTPVSSKFITMAVNEAKEKNITKFDVLGFDYEMGLDFSEISKQGVDVQFKVIPREVFDRRAVEKGHVKFYDVAYIEIKPIVKGRANNKVVSVELCDFSVFYNQDSVEEAESSLKDGASKIVIENGQVIKVSKDKKTALVTKEVLTKKWTDWVDYWSVDFDLENKKEIVRVIDPKTGEEKEVWTGGYIFENEWQSFRAKKDRKLDLISAEKEVTKGKRKIAVKVVDIFGNDTTRVMEVNIS